MHMNSSRSAGLRKYAVAPSRVVSARSAGESEEVKITTGMRPSFELCRMRLRISWPDRLGRFRSRISIAGDGAESSASVASIKLKAVSPSLRTCNSMSFRCLLSDSRTSFERFADDIDIGGTVFH
jgi:hypothetical protein